METVESNTYGVFQETIKIIQKKDITNKLSLDGTLRKRIFLMI